MPRATFTNQATAQTSTSTVWKRLQDAETWANIGPVENVTDPVVDENGDLQSFRWSTSVARRRYPGTAKVTETDHNSRMKMSLDAREVYGTLETTLEPNGNDTTLITITLEVVARGTMSIMFFPMVSETISNGLPDQVAAFAASLGE